jgi:two-component system sensor histidine kinase KdpD
MPRRRGPGWADGRRRALSGRRQLLGLLLALVGLPLLTAGLVPLRSELSLPSSVLLFLLLVVTVALVGGLGPAVFAAVAGFLLLNWYFTPPLGTLTIDQRDHVVALVVFVAVAVLVSVAVEYAAASEARAARSDAEAQLVARLARDAPAEVGLATVLQELCKTFPISGVRVEERPEGQAGWSTVARDGGGSEDPGPAIGPSRESVPERVVPVPDDPTLRLVLLGPPQFAEDARILSRFAVAVGTAVRAGRLAEQAARAERLMAAESLRTTLLAAVGHDLRTPLSGIKAAVSTLRQSDVAWSAQEQSELYETIETSVDQLGRILANLLDLSRIEGGSVRVVSEPLMLDGTVAEAVRSAGSPPLSWQIREDLPPVQADAGLLERVVANLVANAVQHGNPTGDGAELELRASATPDGEAVLLCVVDHGGGVGESDLHRIFAPFQRLDDHGRGEGLGLGLAVARGFVDAMGGTISAAPTPGGGLTVTVRLPVAAAPMRAQKRSGAAAGRAR